MTESKRAWRAEFKRRLAEIVKSEELNGHARSRRVCEALAHLARKHRGLWLAYSALPGEPILHDSSLGLSVPEIQFAYPRLESKTSMKFYASRITNPRWASRSFGLREPDLMDSSWREVDLRFERVQGVLIPGLGFDRRLRRLGRGGGFYDRFLEANSILKVGVSFAEQLVEELPYETHDVGLDRLVTDRETIWNLSGRDVG